MCQTSVILEKDNKQETIMESVTTLEVNGDEITIATMFEQPKTYRARIKHINFLDGLVTLTALNGTKDRQ